MARLRRCLLDVQVALETMFRIAAFRLIHQNGTRPLLRQGLRMVASDATPVSYTHLTLLTSDLV